MRRLPFRPIALVLATAAVALPVTAYALREDPAQTEESESARKERKARKLMEVMGQREVLEQSTVAGSEAFAKMGLPESFTEAFLDRFDYDRMIDETIAIYVEKLEEETLDALVTFYASEQGQLFVAELPTISVASLRMGQKYGEELATEIVQSK
jgi:hypothetical protein